MKTYASFREPRIEFLCFEQYLRSFFLRNEQSGDFRTKAASKSI